MFFTKKRIWKLFRKDLLYMRGFFLGLFCFLAGFSGSAAVNLTKKFVKKLIIGKAVSVYDLHNRIFCGDQFVMDMGEPYLVNMAGKIHSHLLFEKTAEIFPVQSQFSGNILQKNGMPVIFFHI